MSLPARLRLPDEGDRRLGRRRDGDEPSLEQRSRLHPLRGDDRQQSADPRQALLVRRPRLPRRPDLQHPERRPEGQARRRRSRARRARPPPPPSTRRATGKHGKKKRKKKPGRWRPRHETEDITFPESGRLIAGAGHVHGGAIKETLTEPELRQSPGGGINPDLGPRRPSLLQRPADPARARADQHERFPEHDRPTDPRGRDGSAQLDLRRLTASRPGHGDHGRLSRALTPRSRRTAARSPTGTTFSTDQPGRIGSDPVHHSADRSRRERSGDDRSTRRPGRIQKAGRNTVIPVGDRYFGAPNLRVQQGLLPDLAVQRQGAAQRHPRQRAARASARTTWTAAAPSPRSSIAPAPTASSAPCTRCRCRSASIVTAQEEAQEAQGGRPLRHQIAATSGRPT